MNQFENESVEIYGHDSPSKFNEQIQDSQVSTFQVGPLTTRKWIFGAFSRLMASAMFQGPQNLGINRVGDFGLEGLPPGAK